ncbi:MAG: KOW motif-containing protein [Nanoarchaeota archaeon]|nr:KOW motif-containing protein [Nanoarchaeota archaeon]
MIEPGRVCVKLAGRDAGLTCVVIKVDGNRVLIDGQTRRKLCSPLHLEPLAKKLELAEDASHEEVVAALKSIDILVAEKKVRVREPKAEAPVKKPVKAVKK